MEFGRMFNTLNAQNGCELRWDLKVADVANMFPDAADMPNKSVPLQTGEHHVQSILSEVGNLVLNKPNHVNQTSQYIYWVILNSMWACS